MSCQTNLEKHQFSLLRKKLRSIHQSLDALMDTFFNDQTIIRGSVLQTLRKCGKKNCKCNDGELHPRNVLSDKIGGKTSLKTIPKGRLVEVQIKVERYRKLRTARAKLGALYRQMLQIIDRMEKMRREEM